MWRVAIAALVVRMSLKRGQVDTCAYQLTWMQVKLKNGEIRIQQPLCWHTFFRPLNAQSLLFSYRLTLSHHPMAMPFLWGHSHFLYGLHSNVYPTLYFPRICSLFRSITSLHCDRCHFPCHINTVLAMLYIHCDRCQLVAELVICLNRTKFVISYCFWFQQT